MSMSRSVFIGDVEVITNDDVVSESELKYYVDEVQKKHSGKKITKMFLTVDGDYMNIDFRFVPHNFERIRRITGYLVGTVDRWNNGKRAEEHDRVKHGLGGMEML